MKALYWTDHHVYPYNEFSRPTTDGRTTLLEEHEKTYQWIANTIRQEKPDFVFNLGDTAQTIGFLDALSLTCIEQGETLIDDACQSVGAEIRRMIGNHDILSDATRIHVFPFLKNVVSEVRYEHPFLFVPFYRDISEWRPAYEAAMAQGPHRVYIHLDVVGGRFNSSSHACTSGFIAQGPTQVYAGHFHHPQDVGPNIHILGSCMYRNFSDERAGFSPRGLYIDDFYPDGRHTGLGRRIENPHTSIYTTIKQESEDEYTFIQSIEAIEHPGRTYARLVYPKALQSVADRHAPSFRGVRHVVVGDRKRSQVVVPADLPSALDPRKIVDTYLKTSAPNQEDPEPYREYAYDMIDKYIGKITQVPQRRLTILAAHLENFSSYLSADVRFDECGVVYVDGVWADRESDVSNGSGKSSIFESVYWCLFGELIQGATADEIVNTQTRCNCMVSLYCLVDGVEYQFTRYRKHQQFGDDFRIFMNGGLVSQGTTASNKYLVNNFGVTSDLFKQIVLLVDSLSTRFSVLSARSRMELIESVMHLDIYDTLHERIHADLGTKQKQSDLKFNTVQRLSSSLETIERECAIKRAGAEELKSSIELTIADKRQIIQERQASSNSIDAAMPTKNQQLSTLGGQILGVRKILNDYFAQEAEQNRHRMEIVRAQTVTAKAYMDKKALAAGQCPTCLRPYTDAVLEAEIKLLGDRMQAENESLEQINLWFARIAQEKLGYQQEVNNLQQTQAAIRQKVQLMESQKWSDQASIKSAQSDIERCQATLNTQDAQIQEMENRSEALELELHVAKGELNDLQAQLVIASYWDLGFSSKGGCRTWLIQDTLNQLSDFAADYASLLTDGHAVPQIGASGNTITFDVNTQGGSYKRSSSGERRAMDLSIQFALSKLASRFSGFSCNALILDEVDDKLDASARRRLISLMMKISQQDQKIVLIASHNKDVRSHVDRVWTVVRSGGVSRVSSSA